MCYTTKNPSYFFSKNNILTTLYFQTFKKTNELLIIDPEFKTCIFSFGSLEFIT